MVGFEPTNTGATTLGLNHLTTPTTLALFAHCFVATQRLDARIRVVLLAPRRLVRLALCENSGVSQFNKKRLLIGDRERARTVDLQRDRLAF